MVCYPPARQRLPDCLTVARHWLSSDHPNRHENMCANTCVARTPPSPFPCHFSHQDRQDTRLRFDFHELSLGTDTRSLTQLELVYGDISYLRHVIRMQKVPPSRIAICWSVSSTNYNALGLWCGDLRRKCRHCLNELVERRLGSYLMILHQVLLCRFSAAVLNTDA
jgi:hypothetical protein